VLAFRNNKFANPTALIDHIAKHAGRIKLRGDQTLFIAAETKGDAERLKTASMIAAEIAALLPPPAALAA
jgi:transcription-repair coupling factor (superfamily II helicase)